MRMRMCSLQGPLGVLLALSFGVLGCLEDKSIDDWRREQVDQEVAKIRTIEGSYAGSLVRELGEPVGEVQLQLEADTRVSDKRDRPGAEQQAVIRGRISVVTDSVFSLSFEDGSFDSSTGTFKAAAPVLDRAGNPATVKITGSIQGDELTGRLEAERFAESGLAFRVKRGTEVDAGRLQKAVRNKPKAESEVVKRYAGLAVWSGGRETHEVDLQLVTRWAGIEQDFFEFLSPVKTVDATVSVYFNGRAPKGADPKSRQYDADSAQFLNSSIDERIGTLTGRYTGSGSAGDRFTLTLRCQRALHEGSRSAGWDCDYLSNLYGTLFRMTVDPVEESP